MIFNFFLLLCVAATFVPGNCEKKTSHDEERARLPEFLSELDVASAEASVEDVKALRNIVKRLAPEKNGEYLGIQVFFGNKKLLRKWLKGAEITGQPGVDYPALTTIPATSFSCRGQKGGYYADLETNCQVFHICDNGRKISFLCPNGTIFQQSQLICDWWFKVDCSKSAELYEQSAELLAEEERKRIENKKMNSEFHRTDNDDNSEQRFFQNTNYDGRQNGRMNPYGQSATQNQLPNSQTAKTTPSFDPNQIYEKQTTRSGNQVSFSIKDDYNKPQNNRQQNQLISNDGKSSQSNIYDQRGSNKYYNNQIKSSQEDEYYGSAANVNAQREDKQTIKQSTKPRTFTRQNFNVPIQKVTPSYTETTTFRTSTSNPVKEFQHLAESASFATNRGNRYKPHSTNQFNSFYSNNKQSSSNAELSQSSTAATTTVSSVKDRSSPHSFVRSRVGIPAFPGPTYTPIYKPRTTTVSPREAPTTTERAYTNTDFYRSTSQEQSTIFSNYETTTLYPEYTTSDSKTAYTTRNYEDRNTNAGQTSFNNERYTTPIPTTERAYYTRDFYRETTTPATTTIFYDNAQTTTRYNDNYSGSYTTVRPVYTDTYNQNTVSLNTIEENGSTTPTVPFFESIQAQDTARFGSTKFSTKNPELQSQTYRPNFISASTEKPSRIEFNKTYDSTIPRRTLNPYDTSVTYQHGKIMSTLGPYIPFTKNYAYTTTSTTPKPNYTPTASNYNQIFNNLVSKPSQTFVSSNYGKSGSRATYLPEKTTQPSFVTEKNILDNRPANEREHALEMLKSLQGLEGNAPNLNLNNVNTSRTGLEIPSSSGPSTLHTLALYFANADDSEDSERPTDAAVNVPYFETTANPVAKKNTSVVEFPASILTQHTISSYIELFNLNNALENNITGDTSYDNSDENLTDEDTSDLDIQQSEGPLAGVKKSNNTKLRELAQVFTQALSAYLQDPDTFKKVLTEIRPTEPPQTIENEVTTASPTTTEDYPSVTKEKDEVLDFSDDINGIRRRRPTTTTSFPETTTIRESFENSRETTYQPYYTPEYISTTTPYPDESLNEAQSGYIHQPNDEEDNKFSYQINNIFDSKKIHETQNYKSTTYSASSSTSGKNYESYFPNEPNKYGGFQNNSANTYSPYGKYVKPSNSTPISDNYVASSTPATYEVPAPQSFAPSKSNANVDDKLREDLTPPAFPSYSTSNTISAVSSGTVNYKPTNTGTSSSSVTPVYKRTQERTSTTKEPFRIRYYDTTTNQPPSESLVTASSIHSSYGNNYNSPDNNYRQNENSINNKKFTNSINHHWTSSPTVTQLWETTVFIDPDHINRGLDNDPKNTQSNNVDYRSTTSSIKDDFLNNKQNNDAQNAVTQQSFNADQSTPWQWASNSDTPTAFSLFPNIYSSNENTATPTPTYTTRSSITTTITSSITTTNNVPTRDSNFPSRISVYNVTENEIQKAQEMFGNLNETSTNTLMKVMKQADSNATVRQLVLLLISHCNGPMNKTMEEEKEQLLNALLRMPVNEFTSEESRELIKGISKLHLPIGRSISESRSTTTTDISTTTPVASQPSVTTFRSRSGRKFKSTTVKPVTSYSKVTSHNIADRSDRLAASESRSAVALEEGTASDNRALDLLRSLYSIAAKWG